MTTRNATAIGFIAVLLWSLLALFTAASGTMPPFQLAAMTFSSAASSAWRAGSCGPQGFRRCGRSRSSGRSGSRGLFGYHALYFAALRLAPPAESGLINYLWPLLIVLFSSLLPGEQLRRAHVVGAFLGFAGVVVLIARTGRARRAGRILAGLSLRVRAAFVWSGYSVLSRRFGEVPTDAVAGFCLATSAPEPRLPLALRDDRLARDDDAMAGGAALGLGPVGAAFYVWDIGMKRGDIRFLGVASYAAPGAVDPAAGRGGLCRADAHARPRPAG